MTTAAAMGDRPRLTIDGKTWLPLWPTPWAPGSSLYDPPFFASEPLPPNHDMSPAPAERYVPISVDHEFIFDFDKCPHCGKPLSE
jgi:hypothetical protein